MVQPEVPHVGSGESIEVLLEILDDAGAVVVENLLDEAAIEGIVDDLRPYLDAAEVDPHLVNAAVQSFFAGVRHVTGLTARSPTFVDSLLLHPTLLGLADVWFEQIASSYQLNVAHLLVRDPGAEPQMFHRDEDVWVHLQRLVAGVRPHPEVQLAAITALCDFTPEVGATALVPGSHHWDRDRRPQPHEVAHAAMPAGSAVLYRGSVLHAGAANRTDGPRPAIHHSYVAGWLRTEESGLLATRPDVARTLPRRAQELVGYECHDAIDQLGGYLGALDLRNPADLLAEGRL